MNDEKRKPDAPKLKDLSEEKTDKLNGKGLTEKDLESISGGVGTTPPDYMTSASLDDDDGPIDNRPRLFI